MEQLKGADNFFLATEKGSIYNHISGLTIYDPATAPGGEVRFRDILAHIQSRLGVHKLFKSKLISPPMDLDNPYWLGIDELDIEFHIRHIALPHPGDWRQLLIQVARIHSRPIDRSRPMWEMHVIEGLKNIPGIPPGAFAILMKFHHSAVDGMAAANLILKLHALSADEEAPKTASSSDQAPSGLGKSAERTPGDVEMLVRACVGAVGRVGNLSQMYLESLQKIAHLSGSMIGAQKKPVAAPEPAVAASKDASAGLESLLKASPLGQNLLQLFQNAMAMMPKNSKAPITQFSAPLSPNRVVVTASFPLSEVKLMRQKMPTATVNDIFLTVISGAMRHYLLSKNGLPEAGLIGLMPMSLRTADSAESGNQIGGTPVPLHTEIADPMERLETIHSSVDKVKLQADVLGRDLLNKVMNIFPPYLVDLLMNKVVLPQVNTIVSNVRGPDVPLYLAGARMLQIYPISIPLDGVGINNTGLSYNGMMLIAATSCRKIMPDPDFYAACLNRSFDELKSGFAQLAVPTSAQPTTARASKPGKTAAPLPVAATARSKPKPQAKPKPSKAVAVKKPPTATTRVAAIKAPGKSPAKAVREKPPQSVISAVLASANPPVAAEQLEAKPEAVAT